MSWLNYEIDPSSVYPLNEKIDNWVVFSFFSHWNKWTIEKVIAFTESIMQMNMSTQEDSFEFNVALSDRIWWDLIEDTITNNGDTAKVMNTIWQAIKIMHLKYPTKEMYIIWLNPVRTRFYRIFISKYHEKIKDFFQIIWREDESWEDFRLWWKYVEFCFIPKTQH